MQFERRYVVLIKKGYYNIGENVVGTLCANGSESKHWRSLGVFNMKTLNVMQLWAVFNQ